MNMKKWLIAVAMAAGMGTGASASTWDYNYTGSATNSTGPALSCDVSGILNSGCDVTYNTAGLGVDGKPDTDEGNIDGFPLYSGESVTLDFGFDRVWNEISFGNWDPNDDLQLSFDGGSVTWGPNAGNTADLGGAVSSYLTVSASGAGLYCTGFFNCELPDGLGNDNFTVESISVSSVPLPAAGFLLFGALGGLAALRRKRKAA